MEALDEWFGSPAEVSNSMPYELSWSAPEERDQRWVFQSRPNNELQNLIGSRSLYPDTAVDTSVTRNGTVTEKIKAVLQRCPMTDPLFIQILLILLKEKLKELKCHIQGQCKTIAAYW